MMVNEIFSAVAPAYWAKGIPVIPLRVLSKRPVLDGWRDYCEEMPSEYLQKQWTAQHTNGNVGLPLGKQSRMVAIDIDTDNKDILDAVFNIIPESPWKRVGKKGFVMLYKYNGEPAKKITEEGKGHIVEILSSGNQVVLPPSIHPDTGKPYTSNCELIDVYDKLPSLPDDVYDRLRASLSAVVKLSSSSNNFRTLDFVSLGARDTKMTSFAGMLAFAIIRGEITLVDAINTMDGWCTNMTARVQGDAIDTKKGMSKVIEFIKKDIERGKVLPPAWDEGLTPETKLEWGLDVTEDQEEWDLLRLKEYVFKEFDACDGETDPKRHTIVQYVLKKVAKSKGLTPMDQGVIVSMLRKNDGLSLPLSYYNKELKAMMAGPIEGTSHNQIALATKDLWNERRGQLAFYQNEFWEWSGGCWEVVNEQVIWEMMVTEFGELAAAKRASDHAGILRVLSKTLPQVLSVEPAKGVNFSNGFLNESLKLVNHQPEQGMTYMLDYCYNPEATGNCPKFWQYLNYSWGRDDDFEDKIQALREAMAVTLFGIATKFQKAFLLYGPGQTGKSVLLDIIEKLVPANCVTTIRPNHWSEKHSTAMLTGILANIVGEIDETKTISGASFKEIIDGSSIKVEPKRVDAYHFRPKAAHWFGSNDLPKSKDDSSGFFRRWQIWSFTRVVKDEDIIRGLADTIINEEIEAIVAWVVESLPDLVKRGSILSPSSHKVESKKMMLRNSGMRSWMEDQVETNDSCETSFEQLYQSYYLYGCTIMGSKTVTKAEFTTQFVQKLAEKGTLDQYVGKKGIMYRGIKLLKPKKV